MRLFIASPVRLENYTGIKSDFNDIFSGKWVEENNLHLTWIFLGNVTDSKTVIKKMQKIQTLEREMDIAELGFFGRPPRILFAKAEEKLLYNKARAFKEAGFDLYRFKPHITLCRIKTIHDYKAYKEKLKEYRKKVLGLILPEINLYESTLTSEGVKYTCKYTLET